MSHICDTCALINTERCPYSNGVPDDLLYGCYRFVVIPKLNNVQGKTTHCLECRYLFRKSKDAINDKSYIMCGATPSLTQKIKPIPNCPHFKRLRKKQVLRRSGKKGSKAIYRINNTRQKLNQSEKVNFNNNK